MNGVTGFHRGEGTEKRQWESPKERIAVMKVRDEQRLNQSFHQQGGESVL